MVNAKEDENGNIVETPEYTGMWAWKHFHKAEGTTTYVKWQGKVQFDDVTFGYVPEKTVLKHVTMYALPGQKVALVGSTGAGKTTITNLINRFYDVEDGKIRYDDINITKINKNDLRRSMAMVLQDTHLLRAPLRIISVLASSTQPTKKWKTPQNLPTRTTSSVTCPRATTLCSRGTVKISRKVNANFLQSHARQ